MEQILTFLRSDIFIITSVILNVIMVIAFIINIFIIGKIKKEYKNFMKKLGNGNDLEEIMKKYILKVEEVNNKNQELNSFYKQIDTKLTKCIQKVGVVRYSAFKDTGSDLSFALALLDEENTGIVLNGIYSREISNIYAKPIIKGNSNYTLSSEEVQAVNSAKKSWRNI